MEGIPVIATERLYFRKFSEGDAPLLWKLNEDPAVTRYTGDPIFSLEQALGVLKEIILPQYDLYGMGRWAVHLKVTGEFMGWCGLKNRPERNEIDLGYRFMKVFWGQGYAYESAMASIEYGFKVLNLNTIIGRAMPENIASWKVLKKCGMRFVREEFVDGHPALTYIIQKATL
ncbi:MAG: GNAT family N-acetyltransferase [Terrimonas sp.]|nr:GNAT family N-acetyltransferase [Terrimonas sp.]